MAKHNDVPWFFCTWCGGPGMREDTEDECCDFAKSQHSSSVCVGLITRGGSRQPRGSLEAASRRLEAASRQPQGSSEVPRGSLEAASRQLRGGSRRLRGSFEVASRCLEAASRQPRGSLGRQLRGSFEAASRRLEAASRRGINVCRCG